MRHNHTRRAVACRTRLNWGQHPNTIIAYVPSCVRFPWNREILMIWKMNSKLLNGQGKGIIGPCIPSYSKEDVHTYIIMCVVIRSIIGLHGDKKIIHSGAHKPAPVVSEYNCRVKDDCPVNGNCLASDVVYQADVTTLEGTVSYWIGMTGGTFKTRFANQNPSNTLSIKHKESCQNTFGS